MDMTDSTDEDRRSFLDLMTHGDDQKAIRDLKANPKLSESMRKVVDLFGDIMLKAIRDKTVDVSKVPAELGEILESEVYSMSFQELLEKRAAEAAAEAAAQAKAQAEEKLRKEIARKMLIKGDDCSKVVECTGLTEEEVIKIQTELNLSEVI